jgi:tRNA splicing ligase
MSEKPQFLAQYGTREHALKMIQNPEAHIWRIRSALQNQNLTEVDLVKLAFHHDPEIAAHAAKQCLDRGYEVSIKSLRKKYPKFGPLISKGS